jgi:hypothetical protein
VREAPFFPGKFRGSSPDPTPAPHLGETLSLTLNPLVEERPLRDVRANDRADVPAELRLERLVLLFGHGGEALVLLGVVDQPVALATGFEPLEALVRLGD